MKKVYIEVMGCQMNKSDAERMFGMLEHIGYTETENPKDADLLIINTCSIRKLSEDKAYSAVGVWGKWKKRNPNLIIAFCGCVAQQAQKTIFRRAPYVNIVLGTQRLYELPELVKRIEQGEERIVSCEEVPYEENIENIKRVKSVNAWIPIMEGCNNFCSYCIVPYTRGRERSRTPEAILTEAKQALAEGFKEITLLGQNVDIYDSTDKDGNKVNLAELLRRVHALDSKFRIRFVTSYPTFITDELIDTVIELPKVCEYFHIPMQSGDSTVLKRMNRKYDRETYGKICNKIRNKIPDVTITSDFIAGFPGETEEQFQHTLDAMTEYGLDYSNTAAYSPREKTVAARWVEEFIPEDVKFERLARLNKHNQECCLKSNQKFVGKTLEVLVERYEETDGKMIISGRSRNNKMVHAEYDKDITGEFINIKITDAKTWHLMGEVV